MENKQDGPKKKKKLEDCTVEEIRERHIMDDCSDVSEGETIRSMDQIRSSTRSNKGKRSTGDLASKDFVTDKKTRDSPRKGTKHTRCVRANHY